MKWILSLAVLVFLWSFNSTKHIETKKLKTPPGTVSINDSLFIDKTEITNVAWREFIMYLTTIQKDSVTANQNLPNNLVWNKDDTSHSPYTEFYYEHPTFNNYPVVGISYEQAVAFCKWRSNTVNALFSKEPQKNPFPGRKYTYRLPTIQEWEAAAENIDLNDIPKKFKNKSDRFYLANVCEGSSPVEISKASSYTAEVHTYKQNKFGIYNMIGNVSEMTFTKGIAKGGNFLLPLDSCKLSKEQHYLKPEAWLGFRCVCEIASSKSNLEIYLTIKKSLENSTSSRDFFYSSTTLAYPLL